MLGKFESFSSFSVTGAYYNIIHLPNPPHPPIHTHTAPQYFRISNGFTARFFFFKKIWHLAKKKKI